MQTHRVAAGSKKHGSAVMCLGLLLSNYPQCSHVCAGRKKEIFAHIMPKTRQPLWELCQGRAAQMPSLFSAAEVLGSHTVNTSATSDEGLSGSHIRNLSTHFYTNPEIFMSFLKYSCELKLVPKGGKCRKTEHTQQTLLSVVLYNVANIQVTWRNANDPPRHAKQLWTC